MHVFNFWDMVTKEYTYSQPFEVDYWGHTLEFPNATLGDPLEVPEGQKALWNGYEWEYVPLMSKEDIRLHRVSEIKTALADIDIKSIRSERAVQLGRSTEADTRYLEQLDDQAIALRAELQQLTPKSKTKKSTPKITS